MATTNDLLQCARPTQAQDTILAETRPTRPGSSTPDRTHTTPESGRCSNAPPPEAGPAITYRPPHNPFPVWVVWRMEPHSGRARQSCQPAPGRGESMRATALRPRRLTPLSALGGPTSHVIAEGRNTHGGKRHTHFPMTCHAIHADREGSGGVGGKTSDPASAPEGGESRRR